MKEFHQIQSFITFFKDDAEAFCLSLFVGYLALNVLSVTWASAAVTW